MCEAKGSAEPCLKLRRKTKQKGSRCFYRQSGFYMLGSPHVARVLLHIPARCLLPAVEEYTPKKWNKQKKKKSGLFVITVDSEKKKTNKGGSALWRFDRVDFEKPFCPSVSSRHFVISTLSWTPAGGEEKQVVYSRADFRPRHFYISTYLLYLDTLMFLCSVSPLIILPSTPLG